RGGFGIYLGQVTCGEIGQDWLQRLTRRTTKDITAVFRRPSLSLPPRPVDHAGTIERPPYDNWLKCKPRAVVPPAIRDVGQVDAVNRMLEIGGPYAERISRQRNAGPPAQGLCHQGNGTG